MKDRKITDENVINQIRALEEVEKRNLKGSYLKGRRHSWKSFFRFLFQAKLPWIFIIVSIAVGVVSTKLGAKFIDYQKIFFQGDLSKDTILTGIKILVIAFIAGVISNFIRDYATNKISMNIRYTLWKKVIKLPMSAYQMIAPRELISRITQDSDLMGTSFMTIIVTLLTSSYGVYLYLSQIFDYHKGLAYVQLALIPVFLILKFIAGRINYNLALRSRFKFASLTRYMMSILVNIPLIKSYNREAYERVRGNIAVEEYTKNKFRLEAFGIGFDLIDQVFQTINDLICILYGGYLVMSGELDLGIWIAFYAFSSGIYAMLQVIANLWPLAKSMQGSIQRIEDIMELDVEEAENIDADIKPADINLENISFSYDGEKKILDNINVTFKEGETTAIVGVSGSGKTTLLNVLLRLYDIDAGKVTYGEKSIYDYKLGEWRNNIAYLQQEAILFNDSIRNNIIYGTNRTVTDDEIYKVIDEVGLSDLVNSYEERLDYRITENGTSISGGERQRFAVARLLLRNANIILLDEATSNLDKINENLVKEAIDKLIAGKTAIIVAHRLETIKNADKIILLSDGEIKATGNHDELMINSAEYRELINNEKGENYV